MDPYRNPLTRALTAAVLCALGTSAALADGPWRTRVATADALLSADRAFDIASAERRGNSIVVTWVIADGYYLYRRRLAFKDADTPAAPLGSPLLPDGETIPDAEHGNLEIYRHTLVVTLPLVTPEEAPQKLSIRFQGCAEAGVCYPPQTRVIDVAPST